MRISVLLTVMVLLAAGTSPSWAQLLVNGDMEDGFTGAPPNQVATGWTSFTDAAITFQDDPLPHSGLHSQLLWGDWFAFLVLILAAAGLAGGLLLRLLRTARDDLDNGDEEK